jgi:hypothetical protein
LALAFVDGCYLLWPHWLDVHAEGGPLETAQLVTWTAACLIAALAALRARPWRDRLFALWLFTAAAFAAARELDLHQVVQRPSSWLPPIHYRLDWFADPAQPLGPKVLWATIFVLAAILVPGSLVWMRVRAFKLLRRGDGSICLLTLALLLLATGYAWDDLLGRGSLGIRIDVTQATEECFEFLGALAFLLGAWYELRTPLSSRVAALPRRRPTSAKSVPHSAEAPSPDGRLPACSPQLPATSTRCAPAPPGSSASSP